MKPNLATKTWVEYRNKENQDGLGKRARGYRFKSDGSQFHSKMKDVIAGDNIIHLREEVDCKNWFVGYSTADKDVNRDATHFILPLKNFTYFPRPISYDSFTNKNKNAILKIISDKPHYQPFQLKLDGSGFRVPEGYYFGVAMPALAKQLLGPIVSQRLVKQDKKPTSRNKGGISKGPSRGGVKVPVLWEAKHSPLVKKIVEYLEMLGLLEQGIADWSPDILMSNCDRKVLIEVKPQATKHNIITAIGQIICYRSPFDDIISIVAAKGLMDSDSLAKVIKHRSIECLDLSGNWRQALRKLLQE